MLITIIAILVALNLLVCVLLYKRDDLEKSQKLLQTLIIWLFPVIGAAGIYLILRSFDKPATRSKGKFGGGTGGSTPIEYNGDRD